MSELLCRRFFATSISAVKMGSKLPPITRKMTPYAMFLKKQIPFQKQEKIADRFRATSEQWKALDVAEKKKYEDMAVKYHEEKVAEFNKLSDQEKKKLIAIKAEAKEERAKRKERREKREEWEKTNHPVKPPTGLQLFVKEQFALKKKNNEQVTPVTVFLKQFAAEWNTLATTRKEKYNKESEKLRTAYKTELAEWKAKMKEETKSEKKAA